MKKLQIPLLLLFSLVLQFCTKSQPGELAATPEEIEKFLHVQSPRWEDQILYFIVTDRFMDGDTSNNDQGAGEYKPGYAAFWNGGDLTGITRRLDYIKELGATGIWITPPVANQWRNPQLTGTGNHGYWASNFVEVDKHLGSLEDYKLLSASLHKNGMYLIQDVVVNHMGDFFTYTGPYNPQDITENFKLYDVSQPTQYPFNHNNALDSVDREMAIFHFTPEFQDHSDTYKKQNYSYADLDDLNTASPLVRKALRSSYNHWIREAGVDGFRFDTPLMVEHEFWHDFIHSADSDEPGIERYAMELGKKKFLSFGETWIPTPPFDDHGPKEAAFYLGSEDKPEMTSVLNFPLFNAIERVFQQRQATSIMTYRLESLKRYFPQPELLLNFIDNHDGARFLTRGSHSSFRQALLFIMTIPGIPVIYYGTEQELKGMRQSMFQGGAGSPDRDYFNTESESFVFLKELILLRKGKELFRRGTLEVLQDNSGGPGIFAYSLSHMDQKAIVVLNTSNSIKFADNIPTGAEPGSIFSPIYSLLEVPDQRQVDETGNISMLLGPGQGIVMMQGKNRSLTRSAATSILIAPWNGGKAGAGGITINGTSEGVEKIGVIVDGDMSRMELVETEQDGSWSLDVNTDHLVNGKHRVTALVMDSGIEEGAPTDYFDIDIDIQEELCARYQDESGDDHGPLGRYAYPSHPSYSGQMDIEEVSVYRMGNNLKLEITMSRLTGIWIPPNGFDHVLLNIFIDLPGQEGIRTLPLFNAEMPQGSAWDYQLGVAGFANSIFSSEGATATHTGMLTGPAAMVAADETARTITISIASEALGYPSKLEGTKLYITTWDGEPGNPRALKTRPELWSFSGGSSHDPKIMDDTELLILECQ